MLLLLRVVVGVEVRDGYFGESVRNYCPSCYGLGLGTLRRRSRVKGKCCGRQSCSNLVDGQLDAGGVWGDESVEAGEAGVV